MRLLDNCPTSCFIACQIIRGITFNNAFRQHLTTTRLALKKIKLFFDFPFLHAAPFWAGGRWCTVGGGFRAGEARLACCLCTMGGADLEQQLTLPI
eukprot:6196258-Pleurochrysis_carterae.AAC.2